LSALHAFAQAILLDDSLTKTLEIVCFEKQTGLGGQWYDAKEGMPNVSVCIQLT
jgi:cation diffusion facilitator CzcD-associated flavoprotein CzcO